MKPVHVRTGPGAPFWTVRVEWAPRWRGWARRFGGWRREHGERKAVFDYSDFGAARTDTPRASGGASGTPEEQAKQDARERRAETRNEIQSTLHDVAWQVDPYGSRYTTGWNLDAAPRTAPGQGLNGGGSSLPDLGGGGGSGGGDGFDIGDLDELAILFLVLIAFVAAAALAWWVVIPVLLVILDVIAVGALLVVGIAARVLLRRPWTVTAVSSAGHKMSRQVVGWRKALAARDEMVAALGKAQSPR